jgi:hypothetical protein
MRRLKKPLAFIIGNIKSNGPLLLYNGMDLWVDEKLLENNLGTNDIWYHQIMMFRHQRYQELHALDKGLTFEAIHQTLEFQPAPFNESWIAARFGESSWFRLYVTENEDNVLFWCETEQGVRFEPNAMEEFYLSMALDLFYSI